MLSVSSTTTLGILTGAQLSLVVPSGDPAQLITALATLTVLVGVLLILASLLRLGFVANFISSPVLTGFKAGVGLVIVFDQLPKLLGVHIDKQGFFFDLLSLFHQLPHTSFPTLVVAVITLLILLGMIRLSPHSPAPLVVISGAIFASWFWGLNVQGVATVGLIPKGLPSLTLPNIDLVRQLLPGALGIALMSFTESIAVARAFVKRDEPVINANRELISIGIANLGGGLFSAMPAGGGTSQTAVVRAAGAVSQKSSLVTAVVAAAVMLLLAPLLALLPYATLATVIIVYSASLIEPKEFIAIYKIRAMEFQWAVIACLGVLVFGTLQGIVVAIIVSLLGLSRQTANLRVSAIGRKPNTDVLRPLSPEYPNDETVDGLLVIRPEGSIYFVNVQDVADKMNVLIAQYHAQIVVLDMSRVPNIEYSALQRLVEGEQVVASNGITLWLAGLNPDVLEMVRRSGLAERLGRERMLFNACIAIERYKILHS